MWQAFRYMGMEQEGDTAALNTWDGQIVTVGGGFAASGGQAGEIYNRMPPAFRRNLYRYGIRVLGDNQFEVLQTRSPRPRILTGNAALWAIRRDPRRRSLLVRVAQDTTPMAPSSQQAATLGSAPRQARWWMMHAQFQQFITNNADMPDAFMDRDRTVIFAALRAIHWLGSITWPRIQGARTLPELLARCLRSIDGSVMSQANKERWKGVVRGRWPDVVRAVNAAVAQLSEDQAETPAEAPAPAEAPVAE